MPTPAGSDPPGDQRSLRITLDPGNVWRVGFVVMAVFAIGLFLHFLLDDGGSVIFTVLMAWFASIAMEPAVARLARRMRRGVATALTMLAVVLFVAAFLAAFGQLFVEQILQILQILPDLVTSAIDWVNQRFNTDYQVQDILTALNLTPAKIAAAATSIAGGLLGVLGSVVGGIFGLFTFALFTFYLSADGPRLRLWMASLFPPRAQGLSVTVWDVTAQKTGSYVAARVILAAINGSTSALVFLIIGMPYWLALGIWTGLVAQFVPTIGTYISIVLPVLVGLLSPNPWIGVIALAWALVYQQVENLTIEPKISAKAVNVHPAVSFAAVMLGAALFGVAGALLAIPVVAMLLSLSDIYRTRFDLIDELAAEQDEQSATGPPTGPDAPATADTKPPETAPADTAEPR